MSVTETHDRAVVDVIAGAVVPIADSSVGTQLHHAEGDSSPGKGVAVAAGADEDVNELGQASVHGTFGR